jgi:Zn-dependent protease with chaperone function
VVENLSITTGTPMPKVYIINDPAPNAFATGRDPQHAIVASWTTRSSRASWPTRSGTCATTTSESR